MALFIGLTCHRPHVDWRQAASQKCINWRQIITVKAAPAYHRRPGWRPGCLEGIRTSIRILRRPLIVIDSAAFAALADSWLPAELMRGV